MCEVNIKPDTLEHLVLYLAEDDWLPIGNASAHASDIEEDIPKRKTLLLGVVRALGAEGYLQIGSVKYADRQAKSGLHWEEWPGTLDEQLEHLEAVYTPEITDDETWYYACWLNLTESGEDLLHTLPEPDDRFFSGLIGFL